MAVTAFARLQSLLVVTVNANALAVPGRAHGQYFVDLFLRTSANPMLRIR